MKSFILTVSLFVCLTLGVSNAQPLPDCLDKFGEDKFNSWNNCTHSVGTEGTMWSFIFKNGEAVFGYMDYKDGKYTGDVNKKQQRHGNGSFVFDNGDMYSGNWRYGKRYGQGTYTYSNGDKYVGEWKNEKKHGQGTSNYGPNSEWAGDKYVGEYKDGKRNGQGTYTYGPNSEWAGDKYVGEYKDGKKHGQGTYTYVDGDKYVGELQDGKMHGQGTYTYSNGDKYVGEWKNEKKHGQGTYTQASGQKYVYVGEWKNSLLNGQAAIYGPDGIIKEGIFKDNELVYAQNNELIQSYKIVCEELGFKPKTEGFGNCVLKMMELNKD